MTQKAFRTCGSDVLARKILTENSLFAEIYNEEIDLKPKTTSQPFVDRKPEKLVSKKEKMNINYLKEKSSPFLCIELKPRNSSNLDLNWPAPALLQFDTVANVETRR